MPKFKVGDVCIILQNGIEKYKHHVGRECTIIDVSRTSSPWKGVEMSALEHQPVYPIDIPGESDFYWVVECCLKKKKPPKEALGSWEEIARTCKYIVPTGVTA